MLGKLETMLPPNALTRAATSSCLLLTAMTILTAVYSGDAQVDPILRPLYFALLFSTFHYAGRANGEMRGVPVRMIEAGFLVLTLSFAVAAVIRMQGWSDDGRFYPMLVNTLERGAVFLLGLTMIGYGVLLWIPELVASQQILRERYDSTRSKLVDSEDARSHMEQHFLEADRMHALGELAAGVAHDLRNPLAIIKGAADAMPRGDRNAKDLAKHSEVICRNVDRAERTISALLDLGRPSGSAPTEVELASSMREVMRLVEVESRRRGVLIHAPESSDLRALADPKLVVQALLNLVLNALQACERGASVRLRLRAIHLAGNAYAALAIEDDGCGLANAVREKLFTPFFTTKADGTGLGLLSSRRIASDFGGGVALYPRTSGGTRALMLLPLAVSESPAAP